MIEMSGGGGAIIRSIKSDLGGRFGFGKEKKTGLSEERRWREGLEFRKRRERRKRTRV